jgi:hypothetical protein
VAREVLGVLLGDAIPDGDLSGLVRDITTVIDPPDERFGDALELVTFREPDGQIPIDSAGEFRVEPPDRLEGCLTDHVPRMRVELELDEYFRADVAAALWSVAFGHEVAVGHHAAGIDHAVLAGQRMDQCDLFSYFLGMPVVVVAQNAE